MGTVYDQAVRDEHYWGAEDVRSLLEELGEGVGESPAPHNTQAFALLMIAMEMRRRNDLFASHGDAHDEQMGGLAQCLDRIADGLSALSSVASALFPSAIPSHGPGGVYVTSITEALCDISASLRSLRRD